MKIRTITAEELQEIREAVPFLVEEEKRVAMFSRSAKPFCPIPQPCTRRFSFREEWRLFGLWRALCFWWRREDSYRAIDGGFVIIKAERDRWA